MSRVLQTNLDYSKAASVVLTKIKGDYDVTLVQEPWVNWGEIMRLVGIGRMRFNVFTSSYMSRSSSVHGLKTPFGS